MSDADVQLSMFADFLARNPGTDIVRTDIDRNTDGTETVHIVYNEIKHHGFDQWHVIINKVPDNMALSMLSEEEKLTQVSTSSQHGS
jgi:hypothetical protein